MEENEKVSTMRSFRAKKELKSHASTMKTKVSMVPCHLWKT
jgi:hypothetical protein